MLIGVFCGDIGPSNWWKEAEEEVVQGEGLVHCHSIPFQRPFLSTQDLQHHCHPNLIEDGNADSGFIGTM